MGCWAAYGQAVASVNEKFSKTRLAAYFELNERGSSLSTELRAGTVTFLAMAYILAVNAGIVADTGGPCSDADCSGGVFPYCRFGDNSGYNPGYLACQTQVRYSMISATAAASLIACFLMGAVANMPLGLAPGMGINAFFTYTVVGFFGDGGLISYQQALAAVFVEGWIFLFLSVTGVRGRLVQLIPKSVMLATAGGIGFFLAFIGLQGSQGIGFVSYDSATLVTIGGCPIENQQYQYTLQDPTNPACYIDGSGNLVQNLGPISAAYSCDGAQLRSGSMWLGIMGGMIMVLLMGRGFKGSIMTGILFVTFISWIQGHSASYLGGASQIVGGEARLQYFDKVVAKPDTSKTNIQFDWSNFGNPNQWAALISFLYLDFLDCTGTLYSMATFLSRSIPGFVNPKTRRFPRQTLAFCVDGCSIIVAGCLGIAPLTVFIESATGIRDGGRTGITAIMISFYFFLSLFFTPIIASIPPYATGPALVLVGAMMMENLVDIRWSEVQHCIPAFLTIAVIPLTYSIAYGVIAGLSSYIFLYIWFLIYDLATAQLYGRTLRSVLLEAVPDAFQPDEPSTQQAPEGSNGSDVDVEEAPKHMQVGAVPPV